MSEELTAADFGQALDKYWHDRPPASLEDVMALYGVLAIAESGSGLYKTSSKLNPFVDDGRLLTISIDLTGEVPTVVDLAQDTLREEDISKLAYSHKSSGKGAKYSLTQIGSKTGNNAEEVKDSTLNRLRLWTEQESVQSLTGEEGHPDGWIIEALDDVFVKDGDQFEQLGEDIVSLLPAEESIPTVMTVRLKLDGSEIDSTGEDRTDWFWPADIDVLTEAMKRYASANAADKNIKSGASEGQATGVVTGQDSRVVGTPESPLGVFSVKHPDAQPNLRKTESWRNYPVSDDVAMLFAKGQELVEQCVYRRGGMETYALPYFAGELTGLKAETLYLAIDSIREESQYLESGDPPMAQVTFNLQEHQDPEIRELAERELRFYTVTLPVSDDKNVVAEEPAAATYWPSALADTLIDSAQGPTLDPARGGFAPSENWPLLDFPSNQADARKMAFALIVGHEFTDAVFAYRDEEGDDFRRVVDHRLIAGRPIDAATLFDEYIRRYADAAEGGDTPAAQLVAEQLVHLETLSRAGLLSGIDASIAPAETAMTDEMDTTDIDDIREHRLDSFLNRPLFDDSTRRAAALAGVLVGQVSWHQDSVRNIGRPLDSGTKGDQITTNGLETALTAALEKAKLYAQDSEHEHDVLFPETVDRLLEETEAMPSEWEIEKRELQFCYVLGHAHGRRSMPNAFELHETEITGDADATEA